MNADETYKNIIAKALRKTNDQIGNFFFALRGQGGHVPFIVVF